MRISLSNQMILAFTFVIIAICIGCSKEDREFSELQSKRHDTERCRQLAFELKETQRGIQLALIDMDCFGGKTLGWSSWILQNSTLSPQVSGGLIGIVNDSNERLSRRIEASRLLWKRTGELTWMAEWYRLVQRSGGPPVEMGRRLLISTLDFGAVRSRIDVPANEDTRLTIDEFTNMFKENIIHPFNLNEK